MPAPKLNYWRTDPEYISLLNYLINNTKDAKPPIKIYDYISDFKEKSGVALKEDLLHNRIKKLCEIIHRFEHIETDTKVRLLFVLSVPVEADFLQELYIDAHVKVDDYNRITHYKSERLELEGDHNLSTPRKIKNYWTTDREIIALFNYLIKETEHVESPMSIKRMASEYKEKSGAAQTVSCLEHRIIKLRTMLHRFDIDKNTMVKVLFALSALVDKDFLEKLREEALVEVDDNRRITYYKANDGSLELIGDHSRSAKNKAAQLESKYNNQKLIRDYFENKNDSYAAPKNEKAKKMGNLIEFITEKCENVDSPLGIRQLAKDFNNHFRISNAFETIRARIRAYCCEIQKLEVMDTNTKVKQLFGLSATLDLSFLKELRKDASVEVDDLNRITKYTANDGRLTLHGDHSRSARKKIEWIEKRKNENTVEEQYYSNGNEDEESEYDDQLEDYIVEYANEEFDGEFYSDDNNYHLDESEDLMKQSNKAFEFDNDTPVKNCSPTEMSIDSSLEFNPPTGRSHTSEKIQMRENKETNIKNTENAVIRTRSGRLSKRRHLDSNFSYDLANSNSSGAIISSSSSYSKRAIPEKKRNKGKTGFISSKRTGSFSNNPIRPNEIDDYVTYYSIEDRIKLEPFRGSIQEDLKEIEGDEDIQQIPKPPQALDDDNELLEVTIKEEQEEPVGNSIELVEIKPLQALDEHNQIEEVTIKEEHEEPVEVKPETSHNPKIKFFEAMQSLILCLDTPSLSWIQSKIYQKMQKIEGSQEVILNTEIVQIIDLLIARMSNHSVENHSKTLKSMNFSNFLCYLKAAILNSKMSGVESLLENISEIIEESQNKRILMENVANALRTTLVNESF